VSGDPTSWAGVCHALDVLKTATRSRGVRIVVVVVQQPQDAPVPEDRATALCRQAGLERKYACLIYKRIDCLNSSCTYSYSTNNNIISNIIIIYDNIKISNIIINKIKLIIIIIIC
jgi:hypothetical protein